MRRVGALAGEELVLAARRLLAWLQVDVPVGAQRALVRGILNSMSHH